MPKEKVLKQVIQVVDRSSGAVVHEVDVSDHGRSMVLKVMDGMSINLDRARFKLLLSVMSESPAKKRA